MPKQGCILQPANIITFGGWRKASMRITNVWYSRSLQQTQSASTVLRFSRSNRPTSVRYGRISDRATLDQPEWRRRGVLGDISITPFFMAIDSGSPTIVKLLLRLAASAVQSNVTATDFSLRGRIRPENFIYECRKTLGLIYRHAWKRHRARQSKINAALRAAIDQS
ncbi:hypothetical protein K469DRAFT_684562 [Zopfia rhizophila CBS 207.26]|uniref:Uncharacterized protein n=1 Tax=Zopfia rhizophila CBS 207.26 TaxID=1314779 RepID=A0A6A6EBH3_9PEZI|nr:hypothetical protein K469DRAFT_684562 [Zopfia rhizophila CBS 207.26]